MTNMFDVSSLALAGGFVSFVLAGLMTLVLLGLLVWGKVTFTQFWNGLIVVVLGSLAGFVVFGVINHVTLIEMIKAYKWVDFFIGGK